MRGLARGFSVEWARQPVPEGEPDAGAPLHLFIMGASHSVCGLAAVPGVLELAPVGRRSVLCDLCVAHWRALARVLPLVADLE